MIDATKMQQLESEFQKILVLPLAKSTFRQMQNAILFICNGDKELASRILESLMTDNITLKEGDVAAGTSFEKFKQAFFLPFNVAREVAERGEFISIVTSDIISHPDMPIFGNRIRKVGGEEFEFLTDAASTVQLLHHFSFRLDELDKLEKNRHVLKGLKKDLNLLKSRIEQMALKASD